MSLRKYTPFPVQRTECYSDLAASLRVIYEDLTSVVLDAVATLKTGSGRPFVIGEYGSADGVGSYGLIRKLVGFLRKRDGDDLSIYVIFEDQPINDFKPIFVLSNGEIAGQRGLNEEFKNVFVLASGTSFYQQCLPANSVDFLFSSLATHWLSRCPCALDDTVFANLSGEKGKAMFQQQAAEDWEEFLVLRATELRTGGCMVLNNLFDPEDKYVHESTAVKGMKTLERIWMTLMEEGIITREEFQNTNFGHYLRTKAEKEAPFKNQSSRVWKAGLRLVSSSMRVLPGLHRGTVDELPAERAIRAKGFTEEMKAWTESGFKQGLGRDRTEREKQAILETYYSRFFEMVMTDPSEIGQVFGMYCMVIRKTG